MSSSKEDHRTKAQLLGENEQLRRQLEEAQQTLEVIRAGDVDALVVAGPHGEQVFTLTGAEHIYRVIAETMNEAALTVDPDGTILFSNQRFCDLMQTPMHEVLGRKVLTFAARPQQPGLRKLLTEARTGPAQRRLTLRAADGTVVPVQLAASPLRLDESTSICLVATDLTGLETSANSIRVLREHQQALEESEARFRAIFESSQDAVTIMDDEGVYVQANPAVEAVFGLPPQELVGRAISDFVGEQIDFPALWRDFLAKGSFRSELPVVNAQGRMRIVEVRATANILPGQHMSVVRDITARKQAEESLQQANEGLQTQAGELATQTEELRVANEELNARQAELRGSEAHMREQASRLEAVLDAAPAIIWIAHDRDCQNITGNRAGREFLRVSHDTVNLSKTGPTPEKLAHYRIFVDGVELAPQDLPIQVVARSGRPLRDYTFEIRFADGSVRSLTGNVIPLLDAEGRPAGAVAAFLDITDRKQAEEALRRSEERYHHLFEDDLTGNFISTPEGEILLCNPAFARMFGFSSAQEAVGTSMLKLYPDPGERKSLVARLQQQERIERLEVWRKRRDGQPIYVVENLVGHFNERGELYEIKGYLFDDTERKQAEEALRKSEEKFAKAFRSSPIAIAVTRQSDGRIIEVNEAMLKLLHFDRAEAIGRTTLDLGIWVNAGDRTAFVEKFATSGSVRDLEYRLRTRDGAIVTVRLSAELLEFGGEPCMLSTLVDMTERKRAEEALRQSEERYHRLFEEDLTGDFLATPDGKVIECNPAFAEIYGFADRAQAAQCDLSRFNPADWADLMARLRAECRIQGHQGVHRRPDGREIHIVANVIGRFDEAAELTEVQGYLYDDTERRRAEEVLRESEERLKRAQEMAHLGSWELDLVNGHLSWSDEVYRIFDVRPQEFRATYEAFLEFVHPDDRAAVDAGYSDSLQEGRNTYEIEHRILRKSTGEVRIVHEKCAHVRDASGRVVRSVGMVHDITERKQDEEALRQLNATLESKVAERTAELEYRARQLQRLALELSQAEDRERKHLAEILHDDLQQQLAAAKFHLGLLNSRARRDPTQQAVITQVAHLLNDAIQKSRNLSHELSPAVLYHSGLAAALNWLAEQIRTKHGLNVTVKAFGEVSTESEALRAFLYRAAQELLFNVVKHARVDEARIRVRRLGRCLCLSVSDRGRGFDPQRLRETPGFGLLSIRERVELLGGRMKIRSAPGRGSTFFIVVPDGALTPAPGTGQLGVAPVPAAIPGARPRGEPRLRVLLADDHEIVREGLASLLAEERDIEVVGAAANGREVIDLADQLHPDVVVMDVAMPLIGGDEATRQIKMHLPQTRIIALSMYEEADLVERMYRAGAARYILKTAPSHELLAAIRGQSGPA
jgi:PAS domain S-box-containing protein